MKGAASEGAEVVDATKAAGSSLYVAATVVRATAEEMAKRSAAVADRIKQSPHQGSAVLKRTDRVLSRITKRVTVWLRQERE